MRHDAWARAIGWVTVIAFVGVPIVALLLLDHLRGWAMTACSSGRRLPAWRSRSSPWSSTWTSRSWPTTHVAAWQQRGAGGRSGPKLNPGPFVLFVPFIYLLARPEERRLARYNRRSDRRKR